MKKEQPQTNNIDHTIHTKFTHLQKVQIVKGYYAGYTGVIKSFKTIKDDVFYTIESSVNDKTYVIDNVPEENIKKKSILPF